MLVRSSNMGAWKKATSAAQASIGRNQKQPKCSHRRHLSTSENGVPSTPPRSPYPSSAESKQKRESDREFLISVLESSATKRDARAYLQTFAPKPPAGAAQKVPATSFIMYDGIRAVSEMPRFVQGPAPEAVPEPNEELHVAIVKLREPQAWDDALLDGVAKTLTQLRNLGLLSVIVLDCHRDLASQQTDRVLKAIGRYGSPGAELVDSGIWKKPVSPAARPFPSAAPSGLFVGFGDALTAPLNHGHILVIPPRAVCEETMRNTPVNPDEQVFALASFFSGLQFGNRSLEQGKLTEDYGMRPVRRALVDRIIVIDPLGGIPARQQGNGAQVFINLEEQFSDIQAGLAAEAHKSQPIAVDTGGFADLQPRHIENLRLAKAVLAILPSNASVVITSPAEAANLKTAKVDTSSGGVNQFAGEVTTRRWQNPLIHNLLTDRPIYSSSLPIGRIKPNEQSNKAAISCMPTTTLAKKGLPVTIFPDPRVTRWLPPKPGAPRLRLTDTCIDLPRLIHLINDSFSRELDAEHYLRRVEDSLAGIIIAGEYDGGAILTWERPFKMDEQAAYSSGRLVPYLDKFAVLKKSQGAGGVADIVFNAMVRDCFPDGVCWRSRKNNPVNKWYFERSCGVRKLFNSNWAMFWTNPEAPLNVQLMKDYEDVCRNVVPSWADKKKAAD
ncbi:hypothetical protein B0H66DRAFT_239451 [Apodospora peruviana]|uniref:Amino-acid acetyltransferase, mitochondrial n=1 Tax=Apodospora peruviana TaxID=516989 RepID=A0AAE0I4X9_9PEZI|nr:hypothetical protein B0H66DRAFT_239451 [Apodospora peruviana]